MTTERGWIYDIDKSEPDERNGVRYTLGEKGRNPLICIGINPSTATPEKLDRTLCRVKKISQSESNDFDGWIMLNVYPKRNMVFKELPEIMNVEWHENNMKQVQKVIKGNNCKTIWAAWGTHIVDKNHSYLVSCLFDLYETINCFSKDANWFRIENKVNDSIFPYHPLARVKGLKTDIFEDFNVADFLQSIKSS
jgi:hypothetical protein